MHVETSSGVLSTALRVLLSFHDEARRDNYQSSVLVGYSYIYILYCRPVYDECMHLIQINEIPLTICCSLQHVSSPGDV